jgi:hypothetical protein
MLQLLVHHRMGSQATELQRELRGAQSGVVVDAGEATDHEAEHTGGACSLQFPLKLVGALDTGGACSLNLSGMLGAA